MLVQKDIIDTLNIPIYYDKFNIIKYYVKKNLKIRVIIFMYLSLKSFSITIK